jgi:hypothetical protein
MAVLSDTDRANLSAEIQRTPDCPGAITKAQLREVFNAIDDWWETTGAAAANAAIPQPQRGLLTTRQKAAIFMMVLRRRYEVS